MKPSRRHAFQILEATITSVAVGKRAAASAIGAPLESIADRRSMEVIGRAYLAEYGTSGIAATLEKDAALGNFHGRQDLNMLLRRRVAQDFADGNTVLVRGWMLSCTEARVCALAALRATAPGDDQ